MAALKRIKESKAYKAVEEAGGTWAGYCALLGFSAGKIDKDLLNLEVLGEEFVAASLRLGLGYRDLATIRALPDETRLQITDGKIVNLEKASKKEIREAVEDLIIRHGQETKRLTTELEGKTKLLKQCRGQGRGPGREDIPAPDPAGRGPDRAGDKRTTGAQGNLQAEEAGDRGWRPS